MAGKETGHIPFRISLVRFVGHYVLSEHSPSGARCGEVTLRNASTTLWKVMTHPVRIYTTPFCGFCRAAVRMLQRKGVAFEHIDVTGDPAVRAWLREASGQRTVPQVFAGERPLGGYSDLLDLEERGELDAILGVTSH